MKFRCCDNCEHCVYDTDNDRYICDLKKKPVELDNEACKSYEPYKECKN